MKKYLLPAVFTIITMYFVVCMNMFINNGIGGSGSRFVPFPINASCGTAYPFYIYCTNPSYLLWIGIALSVAVWVGLFLLLATFKRWYIRFLLIIVFIIVLIPTSVSIAHIYAKIAWNETTKIIPKDVWPNFPELPKL